MSEVAESKIRIRIEQINTLLDVAVRIADATNMPDKERDDIINLLMIAKDEVADIEAGIDAATIAEP